MLKEFLMYPSMFIHFTHVFHEEYNLNCIADIDVYTHVGKFLCIVYLMKGYFQDILLGHSLEIISHCFKTDCMLWLDLLDVILNIILNRTKVQ